jgi:SAM-dependent methyltransferase
MAQLTAAVDNKRKEWEFVFNDWPLEKAKNKSREEREEIGSSKGSLVYGEVGFEAIRMVLQQLPTNRGIFYDLGSGTGRAVFAAATLCEFEQIRGLEILQSLHQAALQILAKYKALQPTRASKIQLKRADILKSNWDDGDVVFANSTCFDEKLMKDIGNRGAMLKQGAYFITLTKPLNSPYFDLVNTSQYRMSWGAATVYIQRRNSNPLHIDAQ